MCCRKKKIIPRNWRLNNWEGLGSTLRKVELFFTCLLIWKSYRGRDRSSISSFTSQMASVAWAVPSGSQEPGIPFQSPTWLAGSWVLEPSSTAFPVGLAGRWIESGAARTGTMSIWDVGMLAPRKVEFLAPHSPSVLHSWSFTMYSLILFEKGNHFMEYVPLIVYQNS